MQAADGVASGERTKPVVRVPVRHLPADVSITVRITRVLRRWDVVVPAGVEAEP